MIDRSDGIYSDTLSAEQTVIHQQRLLRAVNDTSRILLAAINEITFEASVLEGMSIIAHCLNVDRGYIWQNENKHGVSHYVMRFEWQNDFGRRTNPVENKISFPYSDIPTWEAKFLRGECVNGPLNDMSKEEQDRLLDHGMKSVFAIPVYLNDAFWGYVSFDDCHTERMLISEELDILRSVSLIIVNAINRNEQTMKNREEHDRRNKLLNAVNNTASVLLQAEVDEFESSLLRCMEMMGEAVNADRVYFWRNHTINDKLYCTQLYEWSEGADPQQDNEYTIDISYEDSMPGWEETLSSGQSINGIVREMDDNARAQLSPQGILSILVVPVFLNDKFWGFVGFDDCHSERIFSDSEEKILRSGSLLFAHALLRNELTYGIRETARKLETALEEAKAASRAKSNFLSNMSHEMRTPMNAIMGLLQIAEMQGMPDNMKDFSRKMNTASHSLMRLIDDVLDFSDIEYDVFKLSESLFDFNTMVRDVLLAADDKASKKRQLINCNIDAKIPVSLYGDEKRVRQVIHNLLGNAVKFSPEDGEINFNAFLESADNGSVVVKFEVTDNGIGISPDHKSKLFSVFEQADGSLNREYSGIGIGLALSKRIADMLNGNIWVDSELGKGAKFYFTCRLRKTA